MVAVSPYNTCVKHALRQMRLVKSEPMATAANTDGRGGGSQTNAAPILDKYAHITNAVAGGSFIMKSILSEECPPYVFVVNDTAVTIGVYPAVGESMFDAPNGVQTVFANQSALFIPCQNQYGGTLSWIPFIFPSLIM